MRIQHGPTPFGLQEACGRRRRMQVSDNRSSALFRCALRAEVQGSTNEVSAPVPPGVRSASGGTKSSAAARRGTHGRERRTFPRHLLERLVVLLVSHQALIRDFGNFPVEIIEVANDLNCLLYPCHFLQAPKYPHDPDPSFETFSSE